MENGDAQPEKNATPSRLRRWRAPVALALLLTTGLWLRMAGLAEKSVWFDEGFSIMLADRASLAETIALCRELSHPPLYHVLLYPVMKTDPGALELRLFSVAFGMAAVAIYFFLGRAMRDNAAGLFLAAVGALSPFAIHYSQEIRFYSMLMFFSAAQALLAWHWVRRPTRTRAVLLALITALAIYAHYYAAFFTFGVFLFCLAGAWRRESARGVLRFLPIPLLSLVLLSPWLSPMIHHARLNTLSGEYAGGQTFEFTYFYNLVREFFLGLLPVSPIAGTTIYFPRVYADFPLPEGALHFWNRQPDHEYYAFLFVVAALLALGFWKLRREENDASAAPPPRLLFLFCLLLVPAGMTLIHIALKGRFFSRFMVVYIPIVFYWLHEGVRCLPRRWMQFASVGFLLIFLLPSSLLLAGLDMRDQTRESSSWLKRRISPRAVILHSNPWSYLPFDFYMPDRIPQFIYNPAMNDPLNEKLIGSEKFLDDLSGLTPAEIWVVARGWNTGQEDPGAHFILTELERLGWEYREGYRFPQGIKWVDLLHFEKP